MAVQYAYWSFGGTVHYYIVADGEGDIGEGESFSGPWIWDDGEEGDYVESGAELQVVATGQYVFDGVFTNGFWVYTSGVLGIPVVESGGLTNSAAGVSAGFVDVFGFVMNGVLPWVVLGLGLVFAVSLWRKFGSAHRAG